MFILSISGVGSQRRGLYSSCKRDGPAVSLTAKKHLPSDTGGPHSENEACAKAMQTEILGGWGLFLERSGVLKFSPYCHYLA